MGEVIQAWWGESRNAYSSHDKVSHVFGTQPEALPLVWGAGYWR
jgi:hypothetical protein